RPARSASPRAVAIAAGIAARADPPGVAGGRTASPAGRRDASLPRRCSTPWPPRRRLPAHRWSLVRPPASTTPTDLSFGPTRPPALRRRSLMLVLAVVARLQPGGDHDIAFRADHEDIEPPRSLDPPQRRAGGRRACLQPRDREALRACPRSQSVLSRAGRRPNRRSRDAIRLHSIPLLPGPAAPLVRTVHPESPDLP